MDIMACRDVIFGVEDLKPCGLVNLGLTGNDEVDIIIIMLIRDIIFGVDQPPAPLKPVIYLYPEEPAEVSVRQ